MPAFNLEVFNRAMEPKGHTTVEKFIHSEDYLTLPDTMITVNEQIDAMGGDFIRIQGGDNEIFGILQDPIDNRITGEQRFKEFVSLFDANILFDTTLQGGSIPLEYVIEDYIKKGWIENGDTAQNIPGLRTEIISNTRSWGFNLTSDVEGSGKTMINFQGVLLRRALTEYRIGVYAYPDFASKTIVLRIGRRSEEPTVIEADLPTVLSKTIMAENRANAINKVIVYNRQNLMETPIIYYLHPNGTFDTINRDRITPVVYSMIYAEGESFDASAAAEAGKIFQTESNNYADMILLNEADAAKMEIGQQARIISNGSSILAVLTGKESGTTTRLIFGTQRLELTKILKMRR